MFAERLRELRKKNKYTQLDLSIKLGVAKSTIAGYEKGIRKPQQEGIKKMAKLFNTSVDYLLGLTDDKIAKEPSKDLSQLLKDADFHYKGNKVTNEDLDFLIKYLERINKNTNPNHNSSNSNHNSESNKLDHNGFHTEPVQFL